MENDFKARIDQLEQEIRDLRSAVERNKLTVPLDFEPFSETIFKKKVSIPFTTTQPSGTPLDRREAIYFDTANYWIYVFANGAWRKVQLT